MCYQGEHREMAGLSNKHHQTLQRLVPQQAKLTSDLFQAMTRNLNPHLPVLPAFIAMAEAVEKGDFGVLSSYNLVRLPLSIIGTDKVRYRTPIIDWLHESILSMNMSQITIEALRTALYQHGLCIAFLCSCGVVMGKYEDVQAYYGSEDHIRMDRLRSAIDAEGNPVKRISSFEEISVPTMDLSVHKAEERLFARIEELTLSLAKEEPAHYCSWIDAELDNFVQAVEENAVVLLG